MKIEVEVSEELVQRLGKEAIEVYLQKKANSLYESLQKQTTETTGAPTEDTEVTHKAWQKFNKRGMSC